MNWYVVQVISGQERKVKTALEENRIKKNMEDLQALLEETSALINKKRLLEIYEKAIEQRIPLLT